MFEDIANRIYNDYVKIVLNDLLPNQSVANLGSTDGLIDSIGFASKNKYYKGSDYFFNPVNQQFVHFTSFDKAKEIMSSNKLRLYDLNYADDPHEIEFMAKNANIDFENYYRLKSLVYTISFCSFKLSDDDEHLMWRLYGNDGIGVGLVCSFCNDCEKWDHFYYSKIHYDKSDKIAEAFSKHKSFFEELNSNEEDKNAIEEQHLLFNLLQLFAFHKHSIYDIENEYRLLYRFDGLPLNKNDMKRIFTINKRNKMSSFIELNLGESAKGTFELDNSKEYLPFIKIDKIILGYRYSEMEKEEIERVISDIYANNGNNYETIRPTPVVEITSLKDKYFR